MNKYFVALTLFILLTSTTATLSSAQPSVQAGLPSTPASGTTFIEESSTVETSTGTLYGTLAWPQAGSQVPVVLIIAGSGPTDRNGNSAHLKGPNNGLKQLAAALAARGIASLRYDKRGIGETGNAMRISAEKAGIVLREENLSFEMYINDAISWGKQLRADRRFSSLTVLGHSEGSLIGMVAAERMGAHAYVSIAGAGRPTQHIILEQVKAQLSPDLLKVTEEILEQLASGKRVESVPPKLNFLFRQSAQPFLMSWFRYDPAKEIAKLRIPVLIVQGTTDIQASLQDAKLLASANLTATLLWIDGMNHVLKIVLNDREQQVSSYSDPSLPVAPALITGIRQFVEKADRSSATKSSPRRGGTVKPSSATNLHPEGVEQ